MNIGFSIGFLPSIDFSVLALRFELQYIDEWLPAMGFS